MELARLCHMPSAEPPDIIKIIKNKDYEALYAGLVNGIFGDIDLHVSDPTRRCTGTALHCASIARDMSAVLLLLRVGHADPNVQDELGCTALHYAARAGSENIVRELLDKKADVFVLNNHSRTSFEWAKVITSSF